MVELVAASLALPMGAAASSESFEPAEALAVSVTMEGLLFAAFAVGTKLTESSNRGRSPFFSQAWFGWLIVTVIGLVGVGAGASWWEVFGHEWPNSVGELMVGTGLGFGIVMQPIFAAVINHESRKS